MAAVILGPILAFVGYTLYDFAVSKNTFVLVGEGNIFDMLGGWMYIAFISIIFSSPCFRACLNFYFLRTKHLRTWRHKN